MVRVLNQYSKSRKKWLLVFLTALWLEIIAFLLQHMTGLKPCVFCIYERCALLGIMSAGLIGVIAPKTLLRYVAISILLCSSWKGIMLSWEHIRTQLHPSPFITCDFIVTFPNWIPLDKWLPQIFEASNNCLVHQSEFLIIEIPKWLAAVFITYFIIAILIMIAQLLELKNSFF